MDSTKELPASLGYRLPAEWEPHAGTWIAWPKNREDWPGKFGPIPWVYVEIVRLLSQAEPVRILVDSGKIERRARDRLERSDVDLEQVRFFRHKTDRSWVRDSFPSFVVKESDGPDRVAAVDWRFNAWAKYDDWKRDAQIGRGLTKSLGMSRWRPKRPAAESAGRIILEGGAIDTDGRGTLLTTEECLLSETQERNPGLDREGYERVFADYLGIKQVIWLGRGIAGDDTHGHVDDIARFVGPARVVTVVEEDPYDVNHDPLQENLARLRGSTDAEGRPLDVVTLPMPRPVHFEGVRLPASYANFYIANSLVLVPTFNDPADRRALRILAEQFPDRNVVGIHARDLVWGLGTLHCLTHEQPL